jgi:hypothetical protein
MRDREFDEDKTQSKRSANSIEEIGMNGDERSQIVGRQAPMLSLAGKRELSSATNDIQTHMDDGTSTLSREHQMAKGLGKPTAPYPNSRTVKWPVADGGEIYQQENGPNHYKEVCIMSLVIDFGAKLFQYSLHGRQIQENEENGTYSLHCPRKVDICNEKAVCNA